LKETIFFFVIYQKSERGTYQKLKKFKLLKIRRVIYQFENLKCEFNQFENLKCEFSQNDPSFFTIANEIMNIVNYVLVKTGVCVKKCESP
jgi:hypothetical protein